MKKLTARLLGCTLAATLSLASIPPAAQAKPSSPSSNQIVVRLDESTEAAAFASRWGVQIANTMLSSRRIYLLQTSSDTKEKQSDKGGQKAQDGGKGPDLKKVAESMAKDDGVVYAEPNYDLTLSDDRMHYWALPGETSPDETEESYVSQPAANTLRLSEAHLSARGQGTTIAILDTGVVLNHPALVGQIVSGYDYVDDDADPSDDADGIDSDNDGHVDEGQGHGTAIAGLAHLVAPDATILASRVLDSDGNGSVYLMAEAISDAVDAGADVINISAGVEGDNESKVLSDALHDAAHGDRVSIVTAAGNDGNGSKTYPASDKHVISVGSTESNDPLRLTGFSNYGKWVTVAAPGVNLISTATYGYQHGSGTSLSAPLVAGAVALLRSERPDAKSKDVVKAIKESSVSLQNGPKVETGSIDIVAALDRLR